MLEYLTVRIMCQIIFWKNLFKLFLSIYPKPPPSLGFEGRNTPVKQLTKYFNLVSTSCMCVPVFVCFYL